MATGRSTEGRSIAGVVTTNTSTAITAPAGSFNNPEDAGRTITGTGIPVGATIASVTSGTAAVLSAAATASGTVAATVGAGSAASYGFTGWSPESDSESESYSVTAANAGTVGPDRLTNAYTAASQRSRG